MATYDYVCRECGATTELDRLPREGVTMRHYDGKKVCGTFRRNWSSVNINTTNLRSARG